jgi:hypothetical protein
MKDLQKPFYTLTYEDIKNVADEEGFELSEEEFREIADGVGDGIDWYREVQIVLQNVIERRK